MHATPRGHSIASRALSLAQIFYDNRFTDLFEGPLSDAESDGGEGAMPAPSVEFNTGAECPGIPSPYGGPFKELFDGPLSDVEGPDSDPGEGVASAQAAALNVGPEQPAHPPVPALGKKEKGRLAAAARKRRRRLTQQEAEGSDDKQVAKKRRLEAAQEVIYVDYCLPSATNVTKTGWIGKRIADLPRRVFTVSELESDYGMTRFHWDGR
jgi:hypothetical protein